MAPSLAGTPAVTPAFQVFSVKPSQSSQHHHHHHHYQETKDYVTRKSHRKSRAGCSVCKQKRVKCDEQRPQCTRCLRNFTECSYDKTSPVASDGSTFAVTLPQTPPAQSGDSPASQVSIPKSLIQSSADLHLLKHFDTLNNSALLIGPTAEGYHNALLRLAQGHSFLLHTMLALAANHLMEHGVRGWRKAKLAHLATALHQFQRTIAKPIAKQQSDAVLMTCLMINVQYFSWVDTINPQDSWVFSKDPDRICWLSVQQGMGALLEQVRPFLIDTQVLHYFYVAPTDREDVRRLPSEMWELCGVTDEMGPPAVHPNPYHDPLHALALLMPFEPDNFMKYLHFGARIYPPYVELLKKNDHRALLILSYWFALLGTADIWWCKRRVQRDCLAICMLLDAFGSETIRSLLGFPANACGYTLSRRGNGLGDDEHHHVIRDLRGRSSPTASCRTTESRDHICEHSVGFAENATAFGAEMPWS